MAKENFKKPTQNKPFNKTNNNNNNNNKQIKKPNQNAVKKQNREEKEQNFEEEARHWYDQVPQLPEDSPIDEEITLEDQKTIGREALEKLFEHKGKKQTSDEKWMKLAAASGTTSDKMAASVLLVRSSPLLCLKTLDNLLSQSKKKGDKINTSAVESLKELFLFDLLPDNRRLKFFREQQWRATGATTRHLMFWYFEEELKLRYTSFVSTLETCSKNNLTHIRDNSIKAIFDLLTKKPEQEKTLLTFLINKLGDIERKTASKVSFLLLVLLNEHPNMKFIVVREIEIFLTRPHLSEKAKYYAIIFLNQIILLKRDEKVSIKLVEIYFSLFNDILKEESIGNSRMLSALLTGLNRAFPFIPDHSVDKFNEQISILFKIVHVTTFNKSIQALMLLLQLMLTKKQDIAERYYQALYEKLLAPDLHTSSRIAMFFNVIFRSLKVDKNTNRIKSFIKRLLQICAYEKPSFICGSLFIISEVIKMNQSLWSLLIKPEKKEDQNKTKLNNENQQKIEEDSDDDNDNNNNNNDDDNNQFIKKTIDEDEGEDFNLPDNLSLDQSNNNNNNDNNENEKVIKKFELLAHEYDPSKRNPLYSNASNSTLWELSMLIKHYHPSVRAFAKTLQEKHFIDYNGDPLRDFGIISFLDKFVYKNPKKKESLKGGGISIMQSYTPKQIKEPILVNSIQFLKQKESDVPVEDLFFYQYFKEKEERAPRKEKEEKKNSDEEDDEDEDEDDEGDDDDEGEGEEGDIFGGGEGEDEDDKLLFADSDDDDDRTKGEFSYNDLGEDDFEEDEGMNDEEDNDSGFNPSDAMLEKMLIDDAERDGFDDEDEDEDEFEEEEEEEEEDDKKKGGKGKKEKKKKTTFVDAEEFAHLLQDNTNQKQDEWEKQRMSPNFGKRKRNIGNSNIKKQQKPNKKKKW